MDLLHLDGHHRRLLCDELDSWCSQRVRKRADSDDLIWWSLLLDLRLHHHALLSVPRGAALFTHRLLSLLVSSSFRSNYKEATVHGRADHIANDYVLSGG